MENSVRNLILGSLVGLIIGGLCVYLVILVVIPPKMPEKDSMEAVHLCNKLFNEDVLSGDHIESWLVKPMLDKFEFEINSLPEVAQVEVIEKAQPYIDEIKSGEVTERAVNNIAYIIDQAKPKS